ncbi:hypothetical protein Q73_05220 [Bacillus coahuilensis m2-6]|uniref:Uncharacterized protein n=1 Tax=Bacillus coahuilensis p1.1.43 TaxID=1150625 RepID=A0A147K9G2_9BACI|nr:hypothetical protein [Bacillus coahuilensis]KUP07034.1 hypothetical protein Q75_05760 [Bacillus coahuilensis p1.1.43]KUP08592.1 hypothetical protein Q73_05220 [Bacillus coahuilensis m2-6]
MNELLLTELEMMLEELHQANPKHPQVKEMVKRERRDIARILEVGYNMEASEELTYFPQDMECWKSYLKAPIHYEKNSYKNFPKS